MNSQFHLRHNAASKERGGAAIAGTPYPDDSLAAPLSSRSIGEIAREWLINAAIKSSGKSRKKRRIMMLWEHQIITAGDVERLFEKYKLRGA